MSLAGRVVGNEQAKEMVEIFENLDSLKNIKGLTKLFSTQ